MLRLTSSRLARGATAALLMIALAGPALAGHDDWDDDHERRPYPVQRHGESCDRDVRGTWDRGGHGGHHAGYYNQRGHRGERPSYGCRPCGRRFASRDRFERHLSHEHRVSRYWAPRVVVEVGSGFMFRG